MRFEVERYAITVTPESKQDEAYIEDTLGLKKDGECVVLQRRNASGLSCIAYLRTVRKETK